MSAIAVASVGIWLFHFLILRGVQQAAFINSIVTVAKVIPILVFIVILIFAFKMDLFSYNLYGGDLTTGLFEQVRATMPETDAAPAGLISRLERPDRSSGTEAGAGSGAAAQPAYSPRGATARWRVLSL